MSASTPKSAGQLLARGDLALFSFESAPGLAEPPAERLSSPLTQHVALLDRDAIVVGVNRAWRRFGLANGGSATTGLGSNYLDVCACAAASGSPGAAEAADVVRAALAGREPTQTLTYPCGGPGLDPASDREKVRWFCMRAIPLPGRHRGAIVVHMDVTSARLQDQDWPPQTA